MRGRSSGKTGPPVPGLTRVGGGAIKPLAGSVNTPLSSVGIAPLTAERRRTSPHRAKRNWNSRNLKLYRHGFYYQNLSTIVHGSKAYIANTEK